MGPESLPHRCLFGGVKKVGSFLSGDAATDCKALVGKMKSGENYRDGESKGGGAEGSERNNNNC